MRHLRIEKFTRWRMPNMLFEKHVPQSNTIFISNVELGIYFVPELNMTVIYIPTGMVPCGTLNTFIMNVVSSIVASLLLSMASLLLYMWSK